MRNTSACALSFDDIAELFARVCGVDVIVVSERTLAGDAIKLVGKSGILGNIPMNYAIPGLDCDKNNLVVFQDVQTDPAFEGHGIRSFFPVVRTLVVAVLVQLDDHRIVTVAVPNASTAFLQSNESFGCFLRVLELVRRLLAAHVHAQQLPMEPVAPPLQAKQSHNSALEVNAALRFLAGTLRKRQTLHEAKTSSYFSVRAWRTTMKKHEQEALISIRQHPSEAVADFIATEIFDLAVRSYGRNTINYVVPIPSGEGEAPDNLPEMLAQRVAEKLECKSLLALQLVGGGVSTAGKPKPKTMKLVMPLEGSILLVTDFAETDQRMDNAQKAIRRLDIPSFAISWIGP